MNNFSCVGKPMCTFLSENDMDEIHSLSLEILEDSGLDVFNEEAKKLLSDAGAYIDGNNVKIPSNLVQDAINSAPGRVVMADRNGNRVMPLERDLSYYGTGSDLINTIDLHTEERRLSQLEDVANAAKLCDALPNIDFIMSYALPHDVPTDEIEIYQVIEMLKNSTKPIIMTAFNDKRILKKIIDICAVVAGGLEELQNNPFLCIYGQFVSPLVHTSEGLDRLLMCAENKIPVIYVPTIMAGTSGPATMAGALALGNAEVLGGLVISQLKRRGAPFIYGGCISSFDMSKMILPYGAPEWHMASAMMSQLSLRYDLPVFSTAGCSDSKQVDEQASTEASLSILLAGLSRANIIHDIGYLESGLTGSLAQITICDEIIAYTKRVLGNFEISELTLAKDVIHTVGPGGNYLMEDHTLENYKKDVWYPTILDRRVYSDWVNNGSTSLKERATEKTIGILKNHQPELLGESVLKEIEKFKKVNG
ncbi:MAG: trimethylamine methyltransferase family protein [Clostridiales bacterium]|nr:trimethylamine methyltransferase family protein [Clostridiales bacterium]